MKIRYRSEVVWEVSNRESVALRRLIRLAHTNQSTFKGLEFSHQDIHQISEMDKDLSNRQDWDAEND